MGPRDLTLAVLLVTLLPTALPAQTVTRRVGRLTITADQSLAFPGGVLVVLLKSSRPLGGSMHAILDGRRCPFFWSRHGARALVPIPPTVPAGPRTLGVEIRGRTRQRYPLQVTIAARDYPVRTVVIPEVKRPLILDPQVVSAGRRLQLLLRTTTRTQNWAGAFRPPVAAEPIYSYGAPTNYVGASPVETTSDAIHGEYHRGMDYNVPAGTPVRAPAAGTVLLAGALPLSGQTVTLDHGQGVISVFFHLGRVDVREGDWVDAGAGLGVSGDSGVAAEPHLHWAVYVHGVAIDPRVMERLVAWF